MRIARTSPYRNAALNLERFNNREIEVVKRKRARALKLGRPTISYWDGYLAGLRLTRNNAMTAVNCIAGSNRPVNRKRDKSKDQWEIAA